jgi:magnesium chelatase subunit D
MPVDISEMRFDASQALGFKRPYPFFVRSAAGRRCEAIVSQRRGKYVRARLASKSVCDVALDATLRAAASRLSTSCEGGLKVRPEDIREKIRRHRSPYVIAFVVDNSWSIHVERTLETTKGVILALLKDARAHKDKVAIVAFRHNRRPDATVCLPPTNSYCRAAERLKKIPLSGTTPLPDALRKAYGLLRQTRIKYQNAIPVMVIITDGLPNVPTIPGGDPYEEIRQISRLLHGEAFPTVVVDTESTGSDASGSICREIAALSGGRYLTLSQLNLVSIEAAVVSILQTKCSQDSGPVPQAGKGG